LAAYDASGCSVVGEDALCLPSTTSTTSTIKTTSPATPHAIGGIPLPSGGLVENIWLSFCAPAAFEVEAAEELSGRWSSLISRDFIPGIYHQSLESHAAKRIKQAASRNLRYFFIKSSELRGANSR